MAGEVHCRRLVRLLEQLGAVQRRLRDERIVVVRAEHPRTLEGADDERDRLELRAALRDVVLVDGERLDVEVVREILEPALVRNLRSEQEKPEGN